MKVLFGKLFKSMQPISALLASGLILWAATPAIAIDPVRSLLLQGETVTGLGAFNVITDVRRPVINSDGTVAFSVLYAADDTFNPARDEAILSGSNFSNLRIVADAGDAAPGLGGNTLMTQFDDFKVRIDRDRNVLFATRPQSSESFV